ncbi:unnamed protein product, partial [Ectocarpus fasciculatus]
WGSFPHFLLPIVAVPARPPPSQATTAVTAASARARYDLLMTIITLGAAIKTTWPASTLTPLASTMTTLLLKWWRTVNGSTVSETGTAMMGTTKQSAVRGR